jgi:CheY-like chemotaxis protein
LHFIVRDTGIGVRKDKLADIFGAFEQADVSNARRFGGTGLGLAISKRIVEMMGGVIWAESNLGQGTEFHFVVQLRRAPESQLLPTCVPEIKEMRVLLVDSGATCRNALCNTVRQAGGSTWTADSAESALRTILEAQAKGQAFDAVILAETILAPAETDLVRRLLGSIDKKKTIVLRSSPGRAAQLTKPVVPAELLQALLDVRSPRASTPSSEAVTGEDVVDLKLRVLLAEDNLVNQKLALRMLQRMGCTVDLVENGRDAVAAFEREPGFDVVLMDIQMPDMDGFEATAAIRAIEKQRFSHTPIIALTAHAMKGDQDRCLSAGMDAYLSKPISFSQLKQALENFQPACVRSERRTLSPQIQAD